MAMIFRSILGRYFFPARAFVAVSEFMIIIDNYFVHQKLYDVCCSTRDGKSSREKKLQTEEEDEKKYLSSMNCWMV